MADLNSSELSAALDEFSEHLRRLGVNLDSAGSRVLTEEQKRQAILNKINEDQKKSFEAQRKALSETITGLSNFGRSLSQGQGSFAPLTSVIGLATKALGSLASIVPVIGGALKGAVEGAGEALKIVTESFNQAYSQFEKIAESGVITTFQDMKDSANVLGLTFGDLEKISTKYSNDLAILGGTAIKGRKQFEMLAYGSEQARREFQRLGIGAAEFTDAQLSYINQQRQAGRLQGRTQAELTESSHRYVAELDIMAKLTGKNRKEIQSELESRMLDTRYRAGIATLGDKPKKSIDNLMTMVGSITKGKKSVEALKNIIGSQAIVGEQSREFATMMQLGGLDILKLAQEMRAGKVDEFTASAMIQEAYKKALPNVQQHASIMADATVASAHYVEGAEMATAKLPTAEDLKKLSTAQGDQRKKTDDLNGELSDAKMAMYNASKNMEQLTTSSGMATVAIKKMAEGLEWITEKMYELKGEDLPAHLKARKEERKLIEQETKARQKIVDAADEAEEAAKLQASASGQQISIEDIAKARLGATEEAKKKYVAVKKQRESATATKIQAEKDAGLAQPPQSTTMGNARGNALQQLKDAGLTLKEGDIQTAEGGIDPRIIEIAKKVQASIPGFKMFTGFNDKFHQERAPGSQHAKGLAFDFTVTGKPTPEEGRKIVEMLKGMGLDHAIDEYNNASSQATGGHFHGQLKALTGGVFNGPKGGYEVQLHGNEAVVPLPDGRSIPVQNVSSQSSEIMTRLFDRMNDRFDTIIDLLYKGNNIQDNIARNMS